MVLWGKSNFGRSRRSRGMHARQSEAPVEGKRRERARRSRDRGERAGGAEILGAITGNRRRRVRHWRAGIEHLVPPRPRRELGGRAPRDLGAHEAEVAIGGGPGGSDRSADDPHSGRPWRPRARWNPAGSSGDFDDSGRWSGGRARSISPSTAAPSSGGTGRSSLGGRARSPSGDGR
ncbi:hypothetical protein Taro_041550 [Colocasia esculenta]|uniref:Uncharacterized protein n=1 Tax=Colocasia esculenta TaxID=4460 RepID=A0A843WBR6_COLES|nr:hypothetical protein [Colocasia esculenta]